MKEKSFLDNERFKEKQKRQPYAVAGQVEQAYWDARICGRLEAIKVNPDTKFGLRRPCGEPLL